MSLSGTGWVVAIASQKPMFYVLYSEQTHPVAYTNAFKTKPKGHELNHVHHQLCGVRRSCESLTEIGGEL